jgi:hypothetical protein
MLVDNGGGAASKVHVRAGVEALHQALLLSDWQQTMDVNKQSNSMEQCGSGGQQQSKCNHVNQDWGKTS